MCSALPLMVFNISVKFYENISSRLKLWSGHKNCKHTKDNNSKSRKTRVTVHMFCMSSHSVKRLC